MKSVVFVRALRRSSREQFIAWFESDQKIDPILKAGIAHRFKSQRTLAARDDVAGDLILPTKQPNSHTTQAFPNVASKKRLKESVAIFHFKVDAKQAKVKVVSTYGILQSRSGCGSCRYGATATQIE